MIVAKIFFDNIDGRDCIVTEIAKRNLSSDISNFDMQKDLQAIYIYPSTYIAISKPVKDYLTKRINGDMDWVGNIFNRNYTFECSDYSSNVGMFGFSETEKGKSVFYLDEDLYVDVSKLWIGIMDSMKLYPNDILKNLQLDEPVDDICLKPLSSYKDDEIPCLMINNIIYDNGHSYYIYFKDDSDSSTKSDHKKVELSSENTIYLAKNIHYYLDEYIINSNELTNDINEANAFFNILDKETEEGVITFIGSEIEKGLIRIRKPLKIYVNAKETNVVNSMIQSSTNKIDFIVEHLPFPFDNYKDYL